MDVLQTKLLRKHKYTLCFDNFSGELYYVQDRPEKSRLTLQIDTKSINCKDRRYSASKQQNLAKRARALVQKATSSSTILLSSAQISAKVLRGFTVEGTLTVGGIARPLKMNAMFAAPTVDGLEIEGDFLFRFSQFDIKVPSSLLGISKLDDQALVQFHFQAVQT